MSTPAPQPDNALPAAAPAASTPPQAAPRKREMRVVSHCSLFYWWPVWAVGFLMFFVSFFGDRMAIVPAGTVAKPRVEVPVDDKGKMEARHVLVLPDKAPEPHNPTLHISSSKNVGVIFVAVLLLVIVITNIPLRGLWSVIVIVFVISLTIIFALLGWWEWILGRLDLLDIRINAAGYFVP